jgi:hypothetical protein
MQVFKISMVKKLLKRIRKALENRMSADSRITSKDWNLQREKLWHTNNEKMAPIFFLLEQRR